MRLLLKEVNILHLAVVFPLPSMVCEIKANKSPVFTLCARHCVCSVLLRMPSDVILTTVGPEKLINLLKVAQLVRDRF